MKKNLKQGISLIEILVATALFSVVMIIAVGSVVSLNDSNKKAQLSRTVMDNLNFAMENMARNLRVGLNYHCEATIIPITSVRDCPLGESSIAFEGYKGSSSNPNDQIIYRLNNGQIERSVDSGFSYFPITSPELTITSFTFYVVGTGTGDSRQPRVLMVIKGNATFKGAIQSTFNVQTSVSQRKLDS